MNSKAFKRGVVGFINGVVDPVSFKKLRDAHRETRGFFSSQHRFVVPSYDDQAKQLMSTPKDLHRVRF